MRKIICLLFFITVLVNGQTPNQGFLVNSVDIGEDLMLFVPDSAVQILRNPARAADYEGEFFYLTKTSNIAPSIITVPLWQPVYYRVSLRRSNSPAFNWRPILFSELNNDFVSPVTINFSYLFGESKNKWLLKVLSTENNQDSDDFEKDEELRLDEYYGYYYQSATDRLTSRKINNKLHQVSLNKIGKLGFANYSFGGFAGINKNNTEYLTSRIYNYVNNSGNSSDISFRDDTDDNQRNNSNVFVGLEFGLSENNWDFISSFVYINADYKDLIIDKSISHSTQYDSLPVMSYQRISDITELFEEKIKADAIQANLYFRKEVEFFNQQSEFFIAMSAYYSMEKQELKTSIDETISTFRLGYDVTDYFLDADNNKKFDNTSQSFNLRSGWLINHKMDDIYLLTGFTGLFMYSTGDKNSFQLINDDIVAGDVTFDEDFYQLELPLYISYSPANWFEVFSGYHIAYINQDYSLSNEIGNLGITEVEKEDIKDYGYYQKTYLGINLKHKSGLRVQIGFNGSLTSYNSWNLSLGYVF